MRIVYWCQFYWPEISAPSRRIEDMSAVWQRTGHEVTIVTGMPNHPTGIVPSQYRGKLRARERHRGAMVLRSWVYACPNQAGIRKLANHLSFALTSGLLSGPFMGGADVVILSSPTIFAAFPAWLTARIRRATFVLEVRDLWPEIFVDLGVLRKGLVFRLLQSMSRFLYRHADLVVPVTEGFAESIVAQGTPATKVSVVTNGADVGEFGADVTKAALKIRRDLRLESRFVVAYVGAHGVSQGLLALLDVASLLRGTEDVHFLFIGDGAEKSALSAACQDLGLTNVTLLPQQPAASIREYYGAADVCLVPLRDVPLFDSFLPSKMFEIMAAGRPIIGSVRGEARRILTASGAALLADPERSDQIAAAVLELRGSPRRRAEMSSAGRKFVTESFSREALALRYAELIAGAAR